MKIKVSEASGSVLDWMVAKCEGIKTDIPAWANKPWVRCTDDNGVQFVCPKFSTDWAHGGPIIARERIATLCPTTGDFWDARNTRTFERDPQYYRGPTPLIAAMRCFVVSKLSDEVEVPDELCL